MRQSTTSKLNTLVSRIPLRTRAFIVMVVGFLLVLGALLHTSSSSSSNANGKDNAALTSSRNGEKKKKKMSSSELLSHLTTIHHQSAKNSGGVGSSASAAAVASAALELANNNNKNSKKSAVAVDNFARQRIRLALANAHRDLQNFNQGIKLSDIERFQHQKDAPSSSSPLPQGGNANNDKSRLANKLLQRVNNNNNNNINSVAGGELKYRWQEAYIHQRAASRPNITLPQHPSTILQRALDLDEALAKKEKVTRPLIHQAIDDGDKTRFGDADHNNGDKKKGEDHGEAVAIAAGGDAVSARGEVVVPGGILRDDSIFVTIASYRDSECAPTILDLYSKARYPRAISVGIAVQHDEKEDDSCIPKEFLSSNENCQTMFGFCPTDNIRTRVVSHKDAKGPTFGRYLGMLMYRGERYIFMMDSHNRFVTHWDFIIVNMYKRLEAGDFGSYDDEQRDIEAQKIFKFPETGSVYRYNTVDTTSSSFPESSQQQQQPQLQDIDGDASSSLDGENNKKGGGRNQQERRGGRRASGKHGISKPVLSHYPEAWFHPSDKDGSNRPLDHRSTTTYMCRGKFLDWGVFRLDGNVVSRPRRPQPQGWAAAGFLFARGEILAEVPFDPYLDYVFDGEEITYSIRMWTHGWDIFSPNENILYHYYGRKKAKRFWEIVPPNWTARKGQGETRIKYLLQSVPKDHSQPSERFIPMAGQTTTSAEASPTIVNNNNNNNTDLLPLGTSSSSVVLPSTSDHSVMSLEDFHKSAPRQWARDIDVYGLGAERPLQAYYPYAGLNPTTRQFKDGWFCARKS